MRRAVARARRAFASTSAAAASASAPGDDRLVVLCILDGWGYRETARDNAVVLGRTPNFDALFGYRAQRGQAALLDACELDVGLPMGQIGNSEVGHMNIGAGRVVNQDIVTIDAAIAEGTFASRPTLLAHVEKLKASGGTCHVMGLVSPGGVHSTQRHVAELANAVHAAGVPVVVHAFTDGRDVPPKDAAFTMELFVASLDEGVRVGSVVGRYFAMDRDNRWDRVGVAYDAVVGATGVAPDAPDAASAVAAAHAAGQTDEFVSPTVVAGYEGMNDGDGVLMANFRADRARQLLRALADPDLAWTSGKEGEAPPADMWTAAVDGGDERAARPAFADVSGMVNYSDRHAAFMGGSLFPPKDIDHCLGEVVAAAGLTQLRAAETEKYPHVTFFLNGGREEPFDGEDRLLVPSPKVATYDLQPEMSAPELGAKLCAAVASGKYNMVVANFANPDMVGHTGDLRAAITAVETVDACLGDLNEAVRARGGCLIATADHGNCEKMWEDATGEPHTAHTLNKVPVFLADYRPRAADPPPSADGDADADWTERKLRSGRLADLAPTMLELLGVEQPDAMTGMSLLVDPEHLGELPDGPQLTRPPLEGNPDAGSIEWPTDVPREMTTWELQEFEAKKRARREADAAAAELMK